MSPTQAQFTKAYSDLPETDKLDCTSSFFETEVKECTFGDNNSDTTVVLFGDSHAAQWLPTIQAIAIDKKWRVITLVKNACSPADIEYVLPTIGRRYVECEQWRAAALRRINEIRPVVVIVASAKSYTRFQHRPVSASTWYTGWVQTLEALNDTGAHILHLRDTPLPGFEVPHCLARAVWQASWRLPSPCNFERDSAIDENLRQLEEQASEQFNHVTYVDLTKYICPSEICKSEREGFVLYRDSHHLTASFARSLAPVLEEMLNKELMKDK
jgi:hypothetical protein